MNRFLCFDFRGSSLPLNVFFFYYYYYFLQIFLFFFKFQNLLIKKKKKNQNNIVLAQLTAAPNWVLTESCIDKNWKLENWNDKTESYRTEMKKTKS